MNIISALVFCVGIPTTLGKHSGVLPCTVAKDKFAMASAVISSDILPCMCTSNTAIQLTVNLVSKIKPCYILHF